MKRRRHDAQKGEEKIAEEVAEEAGGFNEAMAEAVAGVTAVVGTYDGALLGFELDTGKQRFGYAPHVGCVKAIHCSPSGKLASGGTDFMIKLFDLERCVEQGELQEHEESISCMAFWEPSVLISGSMDGQVCVWRMSDYESLLKFRAHRTGVACLAIHPSGRLMASAGRDKSLKLWDLTRGTSAAHSSLEEGVEELEWSPKGESLACLSPTALSVVNPRSGAVATYKNPNSSGFLRITFSTCAWLSETEVLIGDGKGDIRVVKISANGASMEEVCMFPTEGTRSRVKALQCIQPCAPAEPGAGAGGELAVVALSSGAVEVWYAAARPKGATPAAFSLLRTVDTSVRVTCLAVWPPVGSRSKAGIATGGGAAAAGKPAAAGRNKKARRLAAEAKKGAATEKAEKAE